MTPHEGPAPARFDVYVGEARLTLACALDDVAHGLWAVWRSASHALVPSTCHHTIEVRPVQTGVEVMLDGACVAKAPLSDALPVAERTIYAHLGRWFEADRAVLHGALLAHGERALLLVGESGAGKSSLSQRGIERGYRYGGDEVCLSDGERLWGVPRAVLFDPTLVGMPLPDIAAGADREGYRFHNVRGDACFLPICAPRQTQVLASSLSLLDAHVVLIRHGREPGFGPASTLAVIAALHRECRGRVELLTRGLDPDRCHALCWDDLDWAWDQLAGLVGTPAGSARAEAARDASA